MFILDIFLPILQKYSSSSLYVSVTNLILHILLIFPFLTFDDILIYLKCSLFLCLFLLHVVKKIVTTFLCLYHCVKNLDPSHSKFVIEAEEEKSLNEIFTHSYV